MSDIATRYQDQEFTGEKLDQFVVDLQMIVGHHHAGMTPLGMAVMMLSQKAYDNDREKPE